MSKKSVVIEKDSVAVADESIVIEKRQIEILDLIEFILEFFKGSWLIFLVTALFAVGGYALSYQIKQQWTSEAALARPTTVELGNYYPLSSLNKLISGDSPNEQAATEDILNNTYRELKRQIAAFDTITLFWENSDYYKNLVSGDEVKDQKILNDLINNTVFIEGNEEKNQPDRVMIRLDNPKRATELLLAYINYANLTAQNVLYADFIVRWNTLKDQINAASQINLPVVQNGHITEGKAWEAKAKMMNAVTPKFDHKLNAFRYIKAPTLSDKVYPNRFLWASITGAFGLFFSCALVLSWNLRKRKREAAVRG